jgi:putative lipoic acid-binding regulatory protein
MPTSRPNGPDPAFERLGKLLEFPLDYPIRVLGLSTPGFPQAVGAIIEARAPGFDASTLSLKTSSRGKWVSASATVRIESREQLESLYLELSASPLVRAVL